MKGLKKIFYFHNRQKNGVSFAKLLCGLALLAIPLCTVFSQEKLDVQKVLKKGNYKASDLMIAVPGQNFSILATEVSYARTLRICNGRKSKRVQGQKEPSCGKCELD